MTPEAVWGTLITHRPCPPEFLTEFTALFRTAVKGAERRGDLSSRHLQQVFLLGHTCDLALVACTKFLSAVNWALLKIKQGTEIPHLRARIPPIMRFVTSFLAAWQWQLHGWGRWSGPSGCFDVRDTKQFNLKALHDLRTDWRLSKVSKWRNSTRIGLSVPVGITWLFVTSHVLDKVRKIAEKSSVDGVAVIRGGAWSPAMQRFGDHVGEVLQTCPYCLQDEVPDFEHIFRFCDSFRSCRLVDPPVEQMAAVRRAEVRMRTSSCRGGGVPN